MSARCAVNLQRNVDIRSSLSAEQCWTHPKTAIDARISHMIRTDTRSATLCIVTRIPHERPIAEADSKPTEM